MQFINVKLRCPTELYIWFAKHIGYERSVEDAILTALLDLKEKRDADDVGEDRWNKWLDERIP